MGDRVVPLRIGDVEVLVEVARSAGSEQTSVGGATQRAAEAFEHAQDAIVAMASSVATTVSRLAARSARPDRVDVEFGLKFSAKGDVIVASASGEVALRVSLGYDAGHGSGGGPRHRLPTAPDNDPDDDGPDKRDMP